MDGQSVPASAGWQLNSVELAVVNATLDYSATRPQQQTGSIAKARLKPDYYGIIFILKVERVTRLSSKKFWPGHICGGAYGIASCLLSCQSLYPTPYSKPLSMNVSATLIATPYSMNLMSIAIERHACDLLCL